MGVLATDDFNRADGAIGGNWTNLESALVVASNACKFTSSGTDAAASYTAVSWPNDQYAQCVIASGLTITGTDSGWGPILRAADANNYYRITVCGEATNNVTVGKVVATVFTPILRITQAFSNGDTLYAEIQGTTIKVKRNGTQFGGDITDGALASGNAGLMYSSTAALMTVDDFVGGDFAAASVSDEAALRTAHTPVTWRT